MNGLTLSEYVGILLPRRLRGWEPTGGRAFGGGVIFDNERACRRGSDDECGGQCNVQSRSQMRFIWIGNTQRKRNGRAVDRDGMNVEIGSVEVQRRTGIARELDSVLCLG